MCCSLLPATGRRARDGQQCGPAGDRVGRGLDAAGRGGRSQPASRSSAARASCQSRRRPGACRRGSPPSSRSGSTRCRRSAAAGRSAEVAAAMGAPATAAAPRLPARPARPARRRVGWPPAGPPVPGHPAPHMLRRPGVVQAVGAPVAVQFRGGQAPDLALAGGRWGRGRVRPAASPAGPGPGRAGRPAAARRPPGPPPARGRGGRRRWLPSSPGAAAGPAAGCRVVRRPGQPAWSWSPPRARPAPAAPWLPGQVPPAPPAPEGVNLVGGCLLFLVGLLAGLLGLGRPHGGQPQLPGPVRRALRARAGRAGRVRPAAPASTACRTSTRSGLSVASFLLPSRVSTRTSSSSGARDLPTRVGALVVGAEGFGADGQVQVGPVLAPGELDIAALHVLGPVQGQQRPLLGPALGAHVSPRIGQIHPARLTRRTWASRYQPGSLTVRGRSSSRVRTVMARPDTSRS